MAADSLEVAVKGDDLSLKGQVLAAQAGEEVTYHRRERESGGFRRTLTLPVKIDVDRIEAAFKNGVLTVTMPKAHHISIKTE